LEAALTELQEQLMDAIGAKKWSHVDELWLELTEASPTDLAFHEPIIDKLMKKQQPQHFLKLYDPFLDEMISNEKPDQALELMEYIMSHPGDHSWLRERLILSIELAFGEDLGDKVELFLERSGLRSEQVSVEVGLVHFNDLLGARVGEVYEHQSWGIGVVQELDMTAGKAIIDFDLKKNQTMTLEGVRKFLIRMPREHIKNRIAKDKEALREDIKKDPAKVIHQVLKSYQGKVKVSYMKRVLTTRFLTDNEYKNFWNNSRKAIKLDPWVEQKGTGINAQLVLRSQPQSFFDEIIITFGTATSPTERREVLRDVRRHGSDAEMTEQDAETLYLLFSKSLTDNGIIDELDQLKHGLLFLEFSDLFKDKENPVALDGLLNGEKAAGFIRDLEIPDSRRCALEKVFELQEETWAEVFAEVAPYLDSRTASWMEKELLSRGHDHECTVALEAILSKAHNNPDLFVWAARNLLEEKWPTLKDDFPLPMIIEEVLSLLTVLEENFDHESEAVVNEAKNKAAKLRNLLSDGNSKHFKKAVKSSTVEEARRILQGIRLHNALSHQLKYALETTLINEFEDLRTISRQDEEEERKKPSFHYTTSKSLDAKRYHLSQLVSHEIPGMAKVIEIAREMGDLKENSEYHAAKDRQKLLMQQAAELEDLIARARVVESREITPESTRFGTRVKFRETVTGNEREMTLMGMWEADLQNNIISYLTPFGSQLLGKKKGEKFQVKSQDGKETELEILDINVAL
jgi:transcription elongation factor GreA